MKTRTGISIKKAQLSTTPPVNARAMLPSP